MHGIFYFESGQGFPLIFLHGFCESSNIWKGLSKVLSDQFRVVCPDLPGFGKSSLPQIDFSLAEIGDKIVDWSRSIGINKCIVIGHSLGGYISLEILRKHPDFVNAIGLFNSSAFKDSKEKRENRNKLIKFIEEFGVEPFLKTFVPSLFYPPTAEKHKEAIEAIRKEGRLIKPESVIKYASAMRDREDSEELLKTYHNNILLISGEQDQNVPLEKSKAMAAILNKDNAHIISDCAHMSLFEQSEICYRIIRDFAKKLS